MNKTNKVLTMYTIGWIFVSLSLLARIWGGWDNYYTPLWYTGLSLVMVGLFFFISGITILFTYKEEKVKQC